MISLRPILKRERVLNKFVAGRVFLSKVFSGTGNSLILVPLRPMEKGYQKNLNFSVNQIKRLSTIKTYRRYLVDCYK